MDQNPFTPNTSDDSKRNADFPVTTPKVREQKNSHGSTLGEILGSIVVIGVIGIGGAYYLYQKIAEKKLEMEAQQTIQNLNTTKTVLPTIYSTTTTTEADHI